MSAKDTPIRVLAVERHQLARDAMIARLEDHPGTKVVATVSGTLSGKELVDLANEKRADVVILDLSVGPPGADAFEVIDAISDPESSIRLVALARRADGILIRPLREASSFLLSLSPGAIVLPSAVLVNPSGTLPPPAVILSSSNHSDRISSRCPGSPSNPTDMTAILSRESGP